MSKISDVTFAGGSGTEYKFQAYTTDTRFKDVGAVYIFSKRVVGSNGGTHTPRYIGQTDSLSDRIPSHEKWPCVEKNGGNCICVHVDSDEDSRLDKETDLRAAFDTSCNEQLKEEYEMTPKNFEDLDKAFSRKVVEESEASRRGDKHTAKQAKKDQEEIIRKKDEAGGFGPPKTGRITHATGGGAK